MATVSTPAVGLGEGSRRSRKKARTRREIFAAAMALFEERGFDRVTIEQICQSADVARATFFLHFPSKASLLFEFQRAMAAELEQRLTESHGGAVAEYRTMIEHLGERWLGQAEVMGAMLREFLATPEAASAAPIEGADLRCVIEAIVRRGQQRGEFRCTVSPRLAATLFLTTAAAILSGAVYREGEVTPDEVRNQFLTVVLHGLIDTKPRLKWSPEGPRS